MIPPKTRQDYLISARCWHEILTLNRRMGIGGSDKLQRLAKKQLKEYLILARKAPREPGKMVINYLGCNVLQAYPKGHVFCVK